MVPPDSQDKHTTLVLIYTSGGQTRKTRAICQVQRAHQVQHARANLTYNSEYHHTKSDLQQLVIYDSPFEDHTPDIAPY